MAVADYKRNSVAAADNLDGIVVVAAAVDIAAVETDNDCYTAAAAVVHLEFWANSILLDQHLMELFDRWPLLLAL